MSEMVTVRVGRELKEKLRTHKIPISRTVRQALEKEVQKREAEELNQGLRTMQRILRKVPDDEWVRAIRESRDKR